MAGLLYIIPQSVKPLNATGFSICNFCLFLIALFCNYDGMTINLIKFVFSIFSGQDYN